MDCLFSSFNIKKSGVVKVAFLLTAQVLLALSSGVPLAAVLHALTVAFVSTALRAGAPIR
jgi:hypothetical protein